MNGVFLVPVGAIVIIIAAVYTAVARIIRLRASLPTLSADASERLDALERSVQGLEQELAETQERLDFAERLLSKAREDRRIDS